MKKVLFVLGLAMCTTMVMAQAKKVVPKVGEGPQKANISLDTKAPVDYKGSIFTKDDDVVLKTFNFAKDEMTGIVYGVDGAIKAGDVVNVNGTDYTYTSSNDHGRSESNTYWTRVDATDSIQGVGFNTTYPNALQYGAANIPAYMGAPNNITDNNGFMFLSMIEYFLNTGKGNINTYFQLPAVDLPESTPIMDVQWRQYYRKFYDTCYVDYQKGGKWYGIEVNVPNVDVNVNATATALYTLTLPPAATDQSSLTIRFRVAASDASQVYGYFWTIDNVSFIIPANTTRWSFIQPAYLDGFYGMLPQDFTIPVAYSVYSRNRGIEDLTGNKLSLIDVTNNASDEIFSVNQPSMAAGNPSANTLFRISERGFSMKNAGLDQSTVVNQAYPDYWENRDGYGSDDASLFSGYGLRGLPTDNIGLNQFSVVASNDQGLNTVLDTMGYYVSPFVEADPNYGITVEGYRWANDNGVVASQSEFAYQFTSDGYVTDDAEEGHQYEKDYETFVRFNSPSTIPTDENGEPWVFRGLELVTATTLTSDDVAGVRINPLSLIMLKDPSNNDSANIYYSAFTGLATDAVYTISGNSASDEVEYGYTLPNQKAHVVNILYPNQPAIEPNTSYFFGYTMAEGGRFAVAGQQTAYYENADSITYYYENPATAPYYRRFSPLYKLWDAYAYDGVQSRGVYGFNITRYPYIRVIVGPRLQIPAYPVELSCVDDTSYWMTTDGDENMCGMVDSVFEGATAAYYIIPGSQLEMTEPESYYGHMVIDQIYIDNEPVDMTDEDIVSAVEYNVYDSEHGPDSEYPWPALLERYYYRLTLRDVNADHVISATASWHELGINELENMVQIGLAPNPATSQVRVNVTGMNGNVNCSIIDMSGREIYSSSFNANDEQIISLNGVPAGAYFVRITNDNFTKVEKLIVR